MKITMRSELRRVATSLSSSSTRTSTTTAAVVTTSSCGFHCAAARTWAIAHPITAHGPPPKPPTPSAEFNNRNDPRRGEPLINKYSRQQPQQQQQQQQQQGQGQQKEAEGASGQAAAAKSSPLKRRFWKDVNVKESSDGYQILLDTRPVRSPTKDILTVPSTKRHLAEAIALEWDLLTSAQQALKQYLIPLTSLTARAADIAREDEYESEQQQQVIRRDIIRTAMRYLGTDTLLCWVPERSVHNPIISTSPGAGAGAVEQQEGEIETEKDEGVEATGAEVQETLRELQMREAQEIINFLTRTIWPGVELKPILSEDSIMPTSQDQSTLDTIQAWISTLPPYELAGLERAILASKSLLVAVRLVVEWSENFAELRSSQSDVVTHQQDGVEKGSRFGVEEAARVSSLEVTYQTDMWGEVEDTHDVDKEDLRRQLGSVILLVSGEQR